MKHVAVLFTLLSVMTGMAISQTKIYISVGDRSVTATLADTDAARALVALLADGPVTVTMDEYGGFEKVGALPESLPVSNTQITTVPGDIMLYQGRNIVIFYGSNTWSYTRLGKIDGMTTDGLRSFLGSGSVSLTLSMIPAAAIGSVVADASAPVTVYDLAGRKVTDRPLASGFYIINGKKVFIKQK